MNTRYPKYLFALFLLVLIVLAGSCRKDFEFAPSTGNLSFSKDTVFLDTIFSNIGSATYTLKVYNRGNRDVSIPFIGLETGENSSYRLNVDGQAGKTFTDIPLLAKDSLFVFIETTFDVAPAGTTDFLYAESLLFGNGENIQEVELVTLIKDAVFLYPATLSDGTKETLVLGQDTDGNDIRVEGFYLEPEQLLFSNEKPYVIYGYAAVAEGNSLVVQPGARVHFHANSGLLVESGATLQVNGQLSEDQELLENEVIFEGDRLEPGYAREPGQWGTVWIREGSVGNNLENLTLKNATVGLRVDGDGILASPTLALANTQIYNSLNQNLWSTGARITAQNTVLGGAGASTLQIDQGGQYRFTHCTMANYWSNGPRRAAAVSINNFGENGPQALQSADFINSIVDGTQAIELLLEADTSATFNFSFTNCLLKIRDNNGNLANDPLYNFTDTNRYRNTILDQEPDFSLPFNDQFSIGANSAALDNADPDNALTVPTDILGKDRIQNPDIGAYEFEVDQ
ncbi:choice-of-anchor Q domain-containing protein [Flagellimonas flava]|uniref:Right handed beta helix region n=1 Tax=Flagellimonas flava TaxID=570519 RepID=A0A1M5IAK5_9FLAO|nr:choice-of-anchor Q domain-containing protein [Allomuricauda flava]SHG25428.1 hypothetical protein SAMN04488116_0582 [Allomuricauda flava]